MSGIGTRRARKLREQIQSTKAARRNLDAYQLERRKRMAAENVAALKERLTPGYLLNQERALAYWEAAVESLEDDGVLPIRKGSE